MSFDPFAQGPDVPPPENYDPYAPPSGDATYVRQRLQMPAIGLIVVGVLNLFWALYMGVNALVVTMMPAQDMMKQNEAMYKAMGVDMSAQGKSPDEVKMQGIIISWPWALLSFVASILPLVGGLRMLSLRSHALAVCAAIAAMIPCISATACCGMGEVVGIWALVVLLNEQVKAAFQ